jgi:hypothetical protein
MCFSCKNPEDNVQNLAYYLKREINNNCKKSTSKIYIFYILFYSFI